MKVWALMPGERCLLRGGMQCDVGDAAVVAAVAAVGGGAGSCDGTGVMN